MHYFYCPTCGAKTENRPAGDDGQVPYCRGCQKFLFDTFPTCTITLVANRQNKVALLTQNYMSTQFKTLVSGYMQPGESAEESAIREVREELGLAVDSLQLKKTLWFDRGGMLMVAFLARVNEDEFALSSEVDEADWFDPAQALSLVHPDGPGNASYYLVKTFLEELSREN